jgi:oligopeptide transport system substrate-binding protein
MHLLEAGQAEEGVEYQLLAGDQARAVYAHQEAIHNYLQALDYAKESDDYPRAARTLMKLGIAYHNAFQFEQSRQAYEQGFVYWQRAGKGRSLQDRPVAPHALRVASIPPPTLDPGFVDDTTSGSFVDQLFSGLIEFSPDMSVVPNVAKSWDVLDEGRKYRFHLRDDVQWSDGHTVTARDFEFAWKRVLDPALDSPASKYLLDIRGAEDFNRRGGSADGVGVQADGDHTLIVELERPTGFFLQLLQVGAAFPVPQHAVEAHGKNWTEPDKIVTNGPFQIQSWNEDGVTFRRNQNFHGQFEGNVAEVDLRFIKEEEEGYLFKLYDENQIDAQFLFNLSPEEQDRSRQTHADDYITAPGLGVFYVGFDVSRPPFDDVRIRRAFAQSIDREALAEITFRGHFAPATGGMVPPGMPGHIPDGAPPFDPKISRQLLEEAGFSDTSKFPEIECLCSDHVIIAQVSQFLGSQWQQNLGVEVKWPALDWSNYLKRLIKKLPQVWLMGWGADYPDPDSFLRLAIRDRSAQVWKNDEYTDLVERARRTLDHTERMQLYGQAQNVLIDEVPLLPLLYFRNHLLLKPWIAEYPLSPMRWDYFKDVVIDDHD